MRVGSGLPRKQSSWKVFISSLFSYLVLGTLDAEDGDLSSRFLNFWEHLELSKLVKEKGDL